VVAQEENSAFRGEQGGGERDYDRDYGVNCPREKTATKSVGYLHSR
jgi:hypothetical protein